MSNPCFAPAPASRTWAMTPVLRNDAMANAQALPSPSAREWQTNQQFIAMLNAYRSSGGLARAQEVAAMCATAGKMQVSALAGCIVHRQVVSLEWQGKIWLPLFQFVLVDMRLQPGLSEVMAELVVALDDWDIANWFALPNPWLADGLPADLLTTAAPEVLNAARAERYVALG